MLKPVVNAYRESFTGLSRETWLLSTVILINRCGFMAVPFMSLYVTQHLGRSASEAGLIITLFGIGSIAGAAAGGHMTDRFGFRPVQILTSLVGGMLFLVFGLVDRFSTLCLLSLVISFFTEAFRPANFTATASYASEGTITRSYALNRLGMNIGWAVGTTAAGLLASIDYRLLFVVDGSINIIAGLAILWWLPPVKAVKKKLERLKQGLTARKPWKDPLFVRFMLVTTLFATCFFLMFRIGPLFFKESWNMNESVIGMVLGLNGAIIAVFEMVMISRLDGRRPPLHYALIGALSVGISFLFLMLPASMALTAALLSMILFTIGEMFALPFINTFVISRSDAYNRGQYAAGYTLCWSVSQVIGPSGGFYLAERWGYNLLWTLLFLLLCVCALAYHILNKKTKTEPAVITA